jgi:hypothetical protein
MPVPLVFIGSAQGSPTPWFFISNASKGVSAHVSGLESTLTRTSISVDSKWLRLAAKSEISPRKNPEVRHRFST